MPLNLLGWGSAKKAEWHHRALLRLKRLLLIRRTLFIRCLDGEPESLLASALANAEARGLTRVCIFFSHQADHHLLLKALGDPRVDGVGTKDGYPATLLPGEFRDDARVGRYWEPGRWYLPPEATHVYFVGPWRLLTSAMLLQAVRTGTVSLRCRVATSWVSVPLWVVRAGVAMARASGVSTIARAGRGTVRLVGSAPTRAARFGHKALLLKRTLFIRYLDNMPETLVASALADAETRGIEAITVFFSYLAEPEVLTGILQRDRVASTGTKDAQFDSLLPPELLNNPHVGRYWEPGEWALPEPVKHIYFIGPWRLITRAMIREALRRDVASLRVRVATSWGNVPLRKIRTGLPLIRATIRATTPAIAITRRVADASRGLVARTVVFARPDWADAAASIAGARGLSGGSLQRALGHMLRHRVMHADVVPGRIVLVCGNLAPGGAERQVAYTLGGLAGRNHDARLLCHRLTPNTKHRYDFYMPAVKAAGVEVREIRRRVNWLDDPSPPGMKEVARLLPSGLARDIADLYREFVELRPEVVHTWLDWDNVRGGIAAALAGVPRIILSGRNINPSHFALYQSHMDPAYRALARLPNVTLINNSRAGADDYADWIGIPREHIGVVHNAVDFGERSRLPTDERAALRASFGIPDSVFLVGGVFRLEEEKRPMLWIETAAVLARQIPDVRFVIFGHGTLHDAILQAAEREKIADRLTLAGVTHDVVSAMSIMDVFLLTSFGEGLPNVLLEAQWVGTAVVATDVGGSKEALELGVTGWALDTGAPYELATKIKWLYDNPRVLQAARARGPDWVREQFGVNRMVADTIRIYQIANGAVQTAQVSAAAN